MWTACHLLWFPSRPLPLHTLCPVMMQLYSAHIHSAPIPTALMMGKWWAVISAIAGSISPASGSRRGLQRLSCLMSICVPPVPQLRLPARLLLNANGRMWRLLYYSAVHLIQPCRQKVQPKQGGPVCLNPWQRLKPASRPVQRHRQRRMPLPLRPSNTNIRCGDQRCPRQARCARHNNRPMQDIQYFRLAIMQQRGALPKRMRSGKYLRF